MERARSVVKWMGPEFLKALQKIACGIGDPEATASRVVKKYDRKVKLAREGRYL
jgi:hypothetical protein